MRDRVRRFDVTFWAADVKLDVSDPADLAFRRHRAQVFRYLRRRTSNDDIAEDLTQEVFVAASEHLARLDTQRQPVLAWLYRVAQNRLLDELRRTRRHPRPLSLDVVAEPGRLDYGDEVGAALRRASARLSRDERDLVGLRLFGECSFAEVAARFGISVPAARMRYLRALRALRAELEKEGVEP
jgi:RNA polymerase sigma factor (sigma-70 family)